MSDADRYWSTEQQRWIYGDEFRIKAEALREAANSARWSRDEHRHVRKWLHDRASQIESGGEA